MAVQVGGELLALYVDVGGYHWKADAQSQRPRLRLRLRRDRRCRTSCLVVERYWDRVRWDIEEHAWRFDGCRGRGSRRRAG